MPASPLNSGLRDNHTRGTVADFLRAVLQRKLHEFYLHLAPSEDLIPAKSPAKQRTKH